MTLKFLAEESVCEESEDFFQILKGATATKYDIALGFEENVRKYCDLEQNLIEMYGIHHL